MVPLTVALLLVGRDGVMDEGLDAVVCKIALEGITMRSENREKVADVVTWTCDGLNSN